MSKEELFEKHKGLVPYMIKKYYPNAIRSNEFEDYIQVGYIGLWKAVNEFDESLGFKFSTYACPKILGEIGRYVRDVSSSSIRVARGLKEQFYRYMKDGDPRDIPPHEMVALKSALTNITSLDKPIKEEEDSTLQDFLESGDRVDDVEIDVLLDNAELKDKERTALKLLLEGYSQVDIGKVIGCSQPHVHRLYMRAVEKIKEELNGVF